MEKKETTISKTSFWSYLYIFFYRKSLPNGLCPFFWKNLIAIIFILPYIVLSVPSILLTIIYRNKNYNWQDNWTIERESHWVEYSFINLFIWGSILGGLAVLLGIYHFFTPEFQSIQIIGVIGILLGISLLIAYYWKEVLSVKYTNWKRKRILPDAIAYNNSLPELDREDNEYWIIEQYRSRTNSTWIEIIYSAIEGFYEKNCPVIKWKD